MANIRVDSPVSVTDGLTLTFRSPTDISKVTGLKVYYPIGNTTEFKVFKFADAHGNNIGNLNLFASNVIVKVILDTASLLAYVQNADTNAYLENKFALLSNGLANAIKMASGTYTGTGTVGRSQEPNILNVGFAPDLVIVQSVGDAWRGPVIFMRGCSRAIFRNAIAGVLGSTELAVTWTDKGVQWCVDECNYYGTYGSTDSLNWDNIRDAAHQLNAIDAKYQWVAFGRGVSGGSTDITDDGEGNVVVTTNADVSISDDGEGNVILA